MNYITPYHTGIELEFIVPRTNNINSLYDFCRNLKKDTGIKNLALYGDNGSSYSTRLPKTWAVNTDCSIRPGRNGFGVEISTKPLRTKKDFQALENLAKALSKYKCRVNNTCGMHVHVDARRLTPYQVVCVVDRYNALYDDIRKIFNKSRHRNSFCSGKGNAQQWALAAVKTTKTNFLNADFGDKYSRVNIESYGNNNTLEFRQHQGTLDYQTMVSWAKFCANFVNETVAQAPKHGKRQLKWVNDVEEPFHHPIYGYQFWNATSRLEHLKVPKRHKNKAKELLPEWSGSPLKGLRGNARKFLNEKISA